MQRAEMGEEETTIVSRARTAFNSAAAKAEKVFADFKSELRDSDEQPTKDSFRQFVDLSPSEPEQKNSNEVKQFRWRPPSLGTKQEWHERLRGIGKGRTGADDVEKVESPKMAFAIYDENLYLYNEKVDLEAKGLETPWPTSDASNKEIIPPASVLKQLAIALESGKNYSSVKDFLLSTASSSPVRERASLSFSAVKSFVLRGKEAKVTSEFTDDEAWSFIQLILDAEGLTPSRRVGFLIDILPGTMTLPREIHGAPPESLIVKVAEVIGSFKTLRKMALFWCRIVAELRRLWLEDQYIPGIPHDQVPDLCCCLLYQHVQLMNCCVSRKMRRATATSSLESLLTEAGCDADGVPSPVEQIQLGSLPYAKISTGEHLLRLGASHQSDMTMLETGEAIYAPVTQEGPILTEDLAQEAEEFVLRTGSVGAGCSQLLSDMQAFKAANPGCVLEDFVRWYSPPDWTENESGNDSDEGPGEGDSTPSKGRLSHRMQKAGNLWLTLWETSKPVPAVRQAPLFDEDLAVEGVLTGLEKISPAQLFGQLFRSLIGLGFVIAEAKLSTDENMGKLFNECKDYVVTSCQGEAWVRKIDGLCQVYETLEAMLMRPEDVIRMLKQPEDTNAPEEPKHRLKKFTQIFGRRSKKSGPDAQRNLEDSPTRLSLSNLFDGKSSFFSRKPPKPESPQSPMIRPSGQDENGWTVI